MIGSVRESHGQRFECIGVEPYTTRDNREIELAVWSFVCAHRGCSTPGTTKSVVGADVFHPSRRCEAHKNPRHQTAGVRKSLRDERRFRKTVENLFD